MKEKLLRDRTIALTGASMGIGYAVARQCAADGAKLILISRHREDLQRVAPTLDNGPHDVYEMDVSKLDRVTEFVLYLESRYLRLDGLINCAGIYGPIGRTEDIPPDEFAEAIQVNLFGTFYMCRFLLPLLKKAQRGKIVNFAGGGAASALPNYSAYAVSKAGVVRFTENLALEYRSDRIDANCVGAGFVVTRMHQQTIKAGDRAGNLLEFTKNQMATGGVPPEKAAALTSFLLSPASDGISGKFISASWDPWSEESFISLLKGDEDLATVRRIDNKKF